MSAEKDIVGRGTNVILGALYVSACGASVSRSMEKTAMAGDDLKIRRAAAAEKGWLEAEVAVAPLARVELPSCTVYTAWHASRPGPTATYALLQSGAVVSQADEGAFAKLLEGCDLRSASAASWAELLARFHPEVGPGEVLHQAEPPLVEGERPSPVQPPALSGDRLRFYLRNRETQRLFEVGAQVRGGRVVSVSQKKVG